MTDWNRIKEDYVASGLSLRGLARKYGVSYGTIQARASREGWALQRQGVAEGNPQVRDAIENAALKLLGVLMRAVEELDSRVIVTRTKVKTDDGECTTERRYFEPGGNVDCKDLKVLTGALKDLRDIQMIRYPLDIREQEAKIRNLERQFTQAGDTEVTVNLEGEIEEYAR